MEFYNNSTNTSLNESMQDPSALVVPTDQPKPVYDFLVIGAGSGGLAAARRAASYGKKVAIVENKLIGGTCVNAGCITKKIMFNTAELANSFSLLNDYGFTLNTCQEKDATNTDDDRVQSLKIPEHSFNWTTLSSIWKNYCHNLHSRYHSSLSFEGIDYFQDTAQFQDNLPQTVFLKASGQSLSAHHILIATGSRPNVPSSIPGAELGITSDGFFALGTQPKAVVIVGGGYISIELASSLKAFNSKVYVVHRGPEILKKFDPFLAQALHEHLSKRGIQFFLNASVVSIERTAEFDMASLQVKISQKNSGSEFFLSVDTLIWAVGRTPNTCSLNLKELGIQTCSKTKHISVDSFHRTNIPNVYAVGDVIDKIALTPVAIDAGRSLADYLFAPQKPSQPMDYSFIPSVVFSHPPLACVGMTETEARRKYDTLDSPSPIQIYFVKFTGLTYDILPKDSLSRVPTVYKIVALKQNSTANPLDASEEELVLGLHFLGKNSDEILQGFVVALRKGLTISDLKKTTAIHPSFAEEVLKMKKSS